MRALTIKPSAAAIRSSARVQAVPIPSAARASDRLRSDLSVACAGRPADSPSPTVARTTRPALTALRKVDSPTCARRATVAIDSPWSRSLPHSAAFSVVSTVSPRRPCGSKKEPAPRVANCPVQFISVRCGIPRAERSTSLARTCPLAMSVAMPKTLAGQIRSGVRIEVIWPDEIRNPPLLPQHAERRADSDCTVRKPLQQ